MNSLRVVGVLLDDGCGVNAVKSERARGDLYHLDDGLGDPCGHGRSLGGNGKGHHRRMSMSLSVYPPPRSVFSVDFVVQLVRLPLYPFLHFGFHLSLPVFLGRLRAGGCTSGTEVLCCLIWRGRVCRRSRRGDRERRRIAFRGASGGCGVVGGRESTLVGWVKRRRACWDV